MIELIITIGLIILLCIISFILGVTFGAKSLSDIVIKYIENNRDKN